MSGRILHWRSPAKTLVITDNVHPILAKAAAECNRKAGIGTTVGVDYDD